ncbi:MAG: universal stress protein [Burkholderiaceae bacterium]|nr:universal stress protein [Burkholderiaceae bacterium]
MKILLSVDGSSYTKRMLAFLAAHDDFLRGDHEYTVITVTPKIPPHAARFFSGTALQDYYRDESQTVLAPVQAFLSQLGWTVHYRHEAGSPAELIAATAEAGHFDLLVLGSHGQSALGNLVLGSVATGVLARCRTPVLLIR